MDERCLCKVQASFKVELHPSKLHDVQEGVREHLNGLLFRFQEELEGFVMAYHGVQIQSKRAMIHPYFPYVHIDVKADVLLFKPTVGCMLVGQVIKVAADFIGLLVMGVFNASIPADKIRPEFKCSSAAQAWVSRKTPDQEIKLGTDVRFQVIKLQEQAAFFGIFGSLLDRCTGAVEPLRAEGLLSSRPLAAPAAAGDREAAKGKATDEKKKKKRRHGEGRDEDQEKRKDDAPKQKRVKVSHKAEKADAVETKVEKKHKKKKSKQDG